MTCRRLFTSGLHLRVAQVLKVGCPDMISLDCGKITGRGITMGSSFQVPQLANAHACFGPTPATQVWLAALSCKFNILSCSAAFCKLMCIQCRSEVQF